MKLDRLVLVNWGQLPPGDYEFGNMTLLTGPTGAGKSTMLDGLQTVMTASYQGIVAYNPGQEETHGAQRRGKTKRTLESFICGAEYSLFSRPDGAHGCVAAVFRPEDGETTAKPFTAVVAVAARVDGQGERRVARLERLELIIVDEEALSVADFLKDAQQSEWVAVEDLVKRLKSRYRKVTSFDGHKKDYLCALYGRFRGRTSVTWDETSNAAKAWSQSIAYKPIGSVHDLVRDDILEFDSKLLQESISRISELMRQVCSYPKGERLIVVGTFSALAQILRPPRPAHRLTGHYPIERDEAPTDAPRSSEWATPQADLVRAVLSDFDLVIVDEGHYEPAFVWSQCIRELARPTVLFSATPYRNDFKYFQVRGNFAFNLGYEEATNQHLVRPVTFAGAQYLPKSGCSPSEFSDALKKFKTSVLDKQYWPAARGPRRVIVRCADHESLIRMRDALKGLGSSAVLIHDNVKRDDADKLEFQSVNRALRAPESDPIEYWLHQWKLLEGVDDSTFAAIAIYEPFSASRATIQQIGRIIRVLDRAAPGKEVATVFASADIQSDVQARFERYTHYEQHFAKDPKRALEQESNLPGLLLQSVAPYQYLVGDFRERVPLDDALEPPKYADFAVPLRTSIYRYSGTATLESLAKACAEAMQLEDRYNVTILQPGVAETGSVRLIHYLTCKNSELLVRHSLPIWGLGVMVLGLIGARVFSRSTAFTRRSTHERPVRLLRPARHLVGHSRLACHEVRISSTSRNLCRR